MNAHTGPIRMSAGAENIDFPCIDVIQYLRTCLNGCVKGPYGVRRRGEPRMPVFALWKAPRIEYHVKFMRETVRNARTIRECSPGVKGKIRRGNGMSRPARTDPESGKPCPVGNRSEASPGNDRGG
jgi:hypothetical protein